MTRWPDAWQQMDHMRADPPERWPDWCLLPMAAATAVCTRTPRRLPPAAIATTSALYAWRYARSVWQIEPALLGRLLTQIPDAVDVETLSGLPEWCVYVAADHPEWPGAGVWMQLEADVNTGRPELRVLIDLVQGGLDTLLTIPVYLDRPTLTEALADYYATDLATAVSSRPGLDVHGGELDAVVARLADLVDGYVAIASYLARPEADIVNADHPGVRPARLRSPAKERAVWRVGYSALT